MDYYDEVLFAALTPDTPEVAPTLEIEEPMWAQLDGPLRHVEEESLEPVSSVEWASGRGPRVTRWIVTNPRTFVEMRKHEREVLSVGCRAHGERWEVTGYELRGATILRCRDVAEGFAWIVGRTSSGFVKMGVRSR